MVPASGRSDSTIRIWCACSTAVRGHGRAVPASSAFLTSPHQPFDLPPSDPTGEGSVLLDHIQQVLGLLDALLAEPGQRLSLTERAVLDRAIKETYELAGITEDVATQGKAPPTMTSVQAVLDAEADAELDTNRTIAGSLAERLGVFTSGSLAAGLLSDEFRKSRARYQAAVASVTGSE